MSHRRPHTSEPTNGTSRRGFLAGLSSLAMVGSLVAAYGSLAAFFGRFFYPPRPSSRSWLFVAEVKKLAVGESLPYELPNGSPVHITRRAETGTAGDFLALSSTCPHLGCQVHWEAHNERFFCPCHNGVFTPEGVAVAGPPADAGQSLLQYPLKVEGRLLFVEAPGDQLAVAGKATTAVGPCTRSSPVRSPTRRA